MRNRVITAAVVAALLAAWGASAASAGTASPHASGSATAFSYSGTLTQPNGKYDFQYQVYDSLSGGTSIAGPVINGSVKVTSSKYSTLIDFGSNPFTGGARFLQISWRTTGTTTFTPLTPRVELVAVPYALGVRLPLAESTSSSGTAFAVANTGSGNGLTGSASSGYGVTGGSTTGFAGVYGTSGQNGVYGATSNSSASGVYGHGLGAATGVSGISDDGGYGIVGLGSSTSFAGGYGSSGMNGLYGYTSSATDSGVYGRDAGTGYGVTGFSDSGTGGFFSGGGGSNAAIKLQNGGIQVSGAGADTATPVFAHVATSSNICGANTSVTFLDNPFLNGNPNAFVFLGATGASLQASYDSNGYCGITGRWYVAWTGGNWVPGEGFDVLVIDP